MSPDVARILDANFNRAREALRVMEEYARFGEEDPGGCEAAKWLRHDLSDVLKRLPGGELLAARDTPNDVGTGISTVSEGIRRDARAVFVAAAKRLPEALRAIEEYTKTFDAGLSRAVEALRYRSYALEQRILLRGGRSARFSRVRLYVLITADLCRRDWLQTAVAAIAGGAGCVQLREKGLSDRELLSRARELGAICRQRGVLFIVNDRPDIARLADADGVHLGQEDLGAVDARRIAGPDRLIGLSAHTPEQLRASLACEPDYVSVGPMFVSSTKPQAHVPGPALLETALRETSIPVVAIGGIGPEQVPRLAAVGGRCVCVCSAILGAADVGEACRRLLPAGEIAGRG